MIRGGRRGVRWGVGGCERGLERQGVGICEGAGEAFLGGGVWGYS